MSHERTSRARTRATPARPRAGRVPRLVGVDSIGQPPQLSLDPISLADAGLWGFTPLDPRALAFVRLRSQLLGRLPRGDCQKVIAIVSPRAGAGSSFVATNLAATLAQLHKVCLADLDLRTPTIGNLLGVPACAGVTDVLRRERALADVGCIAAEARLRVLPATAAGAEATSLLASEALPELFAALRREPDTISIIDTPPILAMDDTILITRHVDGVILVVDEGQTTARDVRESLRLLHPTTLIGTVLNRSLVGDS